MAATTIPAIGVSTGGRFAEYYEPRGIPFVRVPDGPMPRAALVQMLAAGVSEGSGHTNRAVHESVQGLGRARLSHRGR